MLDVAISNGALLRDAAISHIKKSKQTRSALQIAATILVFMGLIYMLRITMLDDGEDAKTKAPQVYFGEFADDEEEDSLNESPREKVLEKPSPQSDKLRGDLLQFFQKYNPAKNSGIDAILTKYSNRLPELNNLLRKKYGKDLTNYLDDDVIIRSDSKESKPKVNEREPSRSSYVPPKAKEDPELKLRRFFEYHNPEKVSIVKQLLRKYSLTELNAKLKKKYGHNLLDDVSQIDTSNEATVSDDVLHKRLASFFRRRRPGTSEEFIRRFSELYSGSINEQLRNRYGSNLDGEQLSVEQDLLHQKLVSFFKIHNPSKVSSAGEAARRFSEDIEKLNSALREKYGIDLNGQRTVDTSSESELLRVKFTETKMQSTRAEDVRIHLQASPFLHTVLTEGDGLETSSRGDFPYIHDGDHGDLEVQLDTDVPDPFGSNAVRIICVGMPLTGCEKLGTLAKDVLEFMTIGELEAFTLLERNLPGPSGIPSFEDFRKIQFVGTAATSFFFQELMVKFPLARIVVTVHETADWWDSFKRAAEDGWLCDVRSEQCQNAQRTLDTILFGHVSGTQRSELLHVLAFQAFYDRVMSLVPRNRRIIVDVHGGRYATEAIESITRIFSKRKADDWIKRNIPKPPLDSAGVHSADILAWLHRSEQNVRAAQEADTTVKTILAGLDGAGGEIVARTLSSAFAWTRRLSTSMDWQEALSERGCAPCEAVRQMLLHGKRSAVKFDEDILGGAPIQALLGWLLPAQFADARVIMPTSRHRSWLRDIRCFLGTVVESGTKSLLRTERKTTPASLKSAYALLYGYETWNKDPQSVSDYFLQRRYQDFVDSVAILVRPTQLLLLDTSRTEKWDRLCMHLPSAPARCNDKMAASNQRVLVPFC